VELVVRVQLLVEAVVAATMHQAVQVASVRLL
jgi:hypothetical protein